MLSLMLGNGPLDTTLFQEVSDTQVSFLGTTVSAVNVQVADGPFRGEDGHDYPLYFEFGGAQFWYAVAVWSDRAEIAVHTKPSGEHLTDNLVLLSTAHAGSQRLLEETLQVCLADYADKVAA